MGGRAKDIIDINEDWAISSDSACVTIYKKAIHKETGEMYHATKWHYNNFVQALQGLADRAIIVKGSFEDMIEKVGELKQDIEIIVKKVDKNYLKYRYPKLEKVTKWSTLEDRK